MEYAHPDTLACVFHHVPATHGFGANNVRMNNAGGGKKDVPFFPYAPYQPQADMSVAVGGFSRHHSEQLPTVEEDAQEEEEEEQGREDNERVCTCLDVELAGINFCSTAEQPWVCTHHPSWYKYRSCCAHKPAERWSCQLTLQCLSCCIACSCNPYCDLHMKEVLSWSPDSVSLRITFNNWVVCAR